MKKLEAYIKPHKLDEVTLAMHTVEGLTGMSVTKVEGFGRGRNGQKDGAIVAVDSPIDFVPHVKIEIVGTDVLVGEIVSLIQGKAHTGLRGDGKIYISAIEDAIRISTNERGESAV